MLIIRMKLFEKPIQIQIMYYVADDVSDSN